MSSAVMSVLLVTALVAVCVAQVPLNPDEKPIVVTLFDSLGVPEDHIIRGNVDVLTFCPSRITVAARPDVHLGCNEGGNVTGIRLREQQLNGTVPTEIGLLTYLNYLELHDNALHGTLPTEMATLENLHFVQLYNNRFRGQLPTGLELCTAGQVRDTSSVVDSCVCRLQNSNCSLCGGPAVEYNCFECSNPTEWSRCVSGEFRLKCVAMPADECRELPTEPPAMPVLTTSTVASTEGSLISEEIIFGLNLQWVIVIGVGALLCLFVSACACVFFCVVGTGGSKKKKRKRHGRQQRASVSSALEPFKPSVNLYGGGHPSYEMGGVAPAADAVPGQLPHNGMPVAFGDASASGGGAPGRGGARRSRKIRRSQMLAQQQQQQLQQQLGGQPPATDHYGFAPTGAEDAAAEMGGGFAFGGDDGGGGPPTPTMVPAAGGVVDQYLPVPREKLQKSQGSSTPSSVGTMMESGGEHYSDISSAAKFKAGEQLLAEAGGDHYQQLNMAGGGGEQLSEAGGVYVDRRVIESKLQERMRDVDAVRASFSEMPPPGNVAVLEAAAANASDDPVPPSPPQPNDGDGVAIDPSDFDVGVMLADLPPAADENTAPPPLPIDDDDDDDAGSDDTALNARAEEGQSQYGSFSLPN